MYKSQIQFKSINIGNEWGQYDDIEANYQDIISRPFPFSTSKPVTKLLIHPATKPIPASAPAHILFEVVIRKYYFHYFYSALLINIFGILYMRLFFK